KAGTGTDRESIGPLSQRLFMILWLKGIIFSITTITPKLQAVAPGKHPLFVIFNGEHKVDLAHRFTAPLTSGVHHWVRGLPPRLAPTTLQPQLRTATSTMEVRNSVHSDRLYTVVTSIINGIALLQPQFQ
uniref:CLIC N-terminal domain-containing protein n=1 Tax=Paramormyrops kingsleyae TaxID=1676925 RepID=A0A3B3RA84_9TELE